MQIGTIAKVYYISMGIKETPPKIDIILKQNLTKYVIIFSFQRLLYFALLSALLTVF